MKILVTGANGQLGALVVEKLLETVPAADLAVSVRDPQKAADLAELGVDVRSGDFDDLSSLDQAFAGVDRLLIISASGDVETRIRQHGNAVKAAQRAGVKFIAYTSATRADSSSIAFFAAHRETEKAIRETGIPFAFLRNNWYAENEAGTVQAAAAGHPVVTSAPGGRVGWAARVDYAAAAAAVVAGPGHENAVYELDGPPRTYADLAEEIGKALGQEVPVQEVDDQTYGAILKGAGVPDFFVEMLVSVQQGIREGQLDVEANDLERLIGGPLTPIADAFAALVPVA